jgi:2'-5' RNA ligase
MNSPDNDPTMRLFFAVPLADELVDPALAVQAQIIGKERKVTRVGPENLHTTLKFIGDRPAGILSQLTDIGRRIAAQHTPFDITVAGAGAFPQPATPGVIWLGVKARNSSLTRIADQLDQTLSDRRIADAENRPFHPHITIARNKGPRRRSELTSRINGAQDTRIGQMTVDSFVLMHSELSPDGPVYTVVERFPFDQETIEHAGNDRGADC